MTALPGSDAILSGYTPNDAGLPGITPDELRELLTHATPAEQDTLLLGVELALLQDDPAAWLLRVFPALFPAPFAAHHLQFWDWIWSVKVDDRPESFVGIWPRGGAKSASVEAGIVVLAIRKARRYCLYVSETQDQADDHVGGIGGILETPTVAALYPGLGNRLVGKYGSVKGWRRNRLRTAAGFTIDALGLDTAARGVKLDDERGMAQRPDLIVLDDIDSDKDGPGLVQKKVDAITRKLIPAGSRNVAFLAVQNLVHQESVFAKLAGIATEPADFLLRRQVSGPIPALEGAAFAARDGGLGHDIIAGEPTWVGQDLQVCQAMLDDMGLTAFRVECQHETDARGGGMFDHLEFRRCRPHEVPPLSITEVWCDPAVTDKDESDSHAVCAGGISDGTIYMLRTWESRATPVDSLKLAIAWAIILGALRVGIETDQGGDTWQSVYREAIQIVRRDWDAMCEGREVEGRPEYVRALAEIDAWPARPPIFDEAKAGSTQQSKAARAQQMLPDYENGRIVHVLGAHTALEAGLIRFPRRKPFDLVDASYWCWRALRRLGQGTQSSAQAARRRRLPPVPTSFGTGMSGATR